MLFDSRAYAIGDLSNLQLFPCQTQAMLEDVPIGLSMIAAVSRIFPNKSTLMQNDRSDE